MIPARTTRRRMLFAPLLAALLVAALSAPTALAAPKTATATLTPSSVPDGTAGTTKSYSFTLAPDSGSIGSFNLTTAASGWIIKSVDSAPAGVTLLSGQIQGRSLSIGSSSPLSVTFTAQAPCSTTNPAWGLTAKSSSNFTGSSFTVNALSTPLSDTCTAAFVAGPADAAFNGDPKSQNITSDAYTPDGDAMQVKVKDAAGATRDGVSITLELRCTPPDSSCGPGGASLSGPVTATSDSIGIATFTGSIEDPINPISIDTMGLKYRLEPTGSGVAGTPSAEFGIYEEGEQCPGASCEVHGNSDDGRISATVSADTPSGSLSVLVSELGLDCTGSIPTGYVYRPLSASVVAWLYTGAGSQTITVLVDKALLRFTDRGSAHLDFCLLVEGTITGTNTPKFFVDKFGETRTEADGPGLLPDCSPTISKNCIVSQSAAQGGDRLVTVTVEDGRGKI